MSYITAQLIISGCLEEDVEFDTEDEFDEWLRKIKNDDGDILSTELWQVFRIVHEHPLVDDCFCAQFLTDHHPYWTNEQK